MGCMQFSENYFDTLGGQFRIMKLLHKKGNFSPLFCLLNLSDEDPTKADFILQDACTLLLIALLM